MSLYKYVTPDRIDILKHGRIRFSQASALNDPIEAHPIFDGISPKVKSMFHSTENIDVVLNSRLLNAAGEHVEERNVFYPRGGAAEFVRFEAYVRELVRKISIAFGENIGALSLTEKPDNLLMWAHYAQQHEGFVIEFEESHPFFTQNEERLGPPMRVAYSVDRPHRASMVDITHQDLFLTKSSDWEYEAEWRLLRFLWDSDCKVQTPKGVVYLFHLPPECVRGILLGCRMQEQEKEAIESLLKKDGRYGHIKMFQAAINSHKYMLDINPLNLCLG